MLNKDAGFQPATSLKTKLLYKYFSKPFSKFLEQVLNRAPLRGCCGIEISKFQFLSALSFVKKPLKSRKCLREILDINVSYLFTVPFIVVYLIPTVRWRLKFGTILSAAVTYWGFIGSLWISQKLWSMKHECIYAKSSRLMSISLLRQPNRAFSLPNAHSKTILADESRLPKNCSFSFFPPLENSFIVYGKSGYAGSPKTQMGTGGSPSMIILLQSGTTPSLKIAFNLEFENIRASCTLPGHFITTSKKQ